MRMRNSPVHSDHWLASLGRRISRSTAAQPSAPSAGCGLTASRRTGLRTWDGRAGDASSASWPTPRRPQNSPRRRCEVSNPAIPAGWIQLQDGSYSPPSAVAKGLVRAAMVVTAREQSERELHEQILAMCRSKGWPVVHSRMDVPSTSGVGTPDFVIALPIGRTVWVEAKTAKGKLRPEQAAWLAALRAKGHRAGVVRSIEEFVMMTEVGS